MHRFCSNTSATQRNVTESNKVPPFVECWCVKKHRIKNASTVKQNVLLSLAQWTNHYNEQILTIGTRTPPKTPFKIPQNSMINMLYSQQKLIFQTKKMNFKNKHPLHSPPPMIPKSNKTQETEMQWSPIRAKITHFRHAW